VLAAATMTQLRNALRVYAFEGLKPASVLSRLNRLVESTGPSFATVLYGVVDTRTMSCRFASAGHLPPLLVRGDGSATFLEGGRSVPLGVRSDADYRQETVQLAPGDTLVLYTDGLVERRGRALDEGLAQLRSCAAEAGQASVDALVQCLVGELTEDELSNDDVAVLALRAAAERRPPLRLTLPSEPAVLAALREQLRDWLAGCNVTGNVCDEIVLACSEACANSIEHAQEPTRPEFEVVAETAGSSIVISVRDFGRWREAQNTPDRGLGLRLIEELMDGVEITRTESGTEVRMRRRLEAALTVPV
jgi:anti-sigma regulatory factor (Ser/Thr protein kinase)